LLHELIEFCSALSDSGVLEMVCEQFYNTLTTEKFWDGQFPKGTV